MESTSGLASSQRGHSTSDLSFTNDWFGRHKTVWSQLLERYRPQKILEVGSYEGASVCYCIQVLSSQVDHLEVHCVDTWEGGIEHQKGQFFEAEMSSVEQRFQDNLKIQISQALCPVDLAVHKGKSIQALAQLISNGMSQRFDMVYIDGSHQASDVIADAVLAFELVRVGGIMIFDDYLWAEPNISRDPLRCPKLAIDAFSNIFFRKVATLSAPLYQVYLKKISH